jgi:hypothetical protein
LDPEYVIGGVATYVIKHKGEKDKTIAEMKDKKDGEKPLDVSTNGYGDGTNYTEAGAIKYYAEKLGGKNHNFYTKKDVPKNGLENSEVF